MNESLETAILYVDPNGSDSNPGTKALPLKTIGKAAELAIVNNQHSIGTRVTISPGTYRESISMGSTGSDTGLPITFEAAANGTVIVSGSFLYTGWQPYSGNPNIFTDSWSNRWGLCPADSGGPFEQDLVLRREMVFVNGTHLTQVVALGQMRAGTFFVDETHATIYVWPPAGTNMNTASVEVATQPSLFSIAGRNDIVLRGLTFQYSNPCRNGAAVSVGGSSINVLIDTDSFLWNNSQGLSFAYPASNFTVQNSVANHNGSIGFQDYQVKNGLWQSDTANYNNWRGAQGAYYAWNSGGCHFFSEHNSTYNQLTILFNQSHGIHWDTDNANLTVRSLLMSQNLLNGAFIEVSEGPVSISSSNICNNNIGVHDQYTAAGGLELRNSENVTLTGSTLLGNGTSQINIQGQTGGIPVTNWETGQSYNLITQNFTSTQNIIEGVGASQQVFHDAYLGGSDWTAFVTTLSSDNNTWWNASNSSAFIVPTSGRAVTFSGWQSAALQDAHSTFAAPSGTPGAACTVTPDSPDYWFVVDSASQTLSSAGTAVFSVAVIPFGFTGTVNLSFDGINEVPGLSAGLNPTTIATSGSSALTVTARLTTAPGTYPVTLIANSGNLTRTVTASLVVPNGIGGGMPSVGLSPNSETFANQVVKTTSAAKTVSLTNTGNGTLNLTSITLVGSSPGDFAQTNNCGTSVAAGGSCTINVTFTPTNVGSRAAAVSIADNATGSPQTVSLTGTGTSAVTLSKNSLTFAAQRVGTTSAPKTIIITNSGTTLTVNSITITGANSKDFAQTNTCGTTVAVGKSCTISVIFKPKATRTRTATASISDSDPASPQTIALTGTGK